MNATDEQHAFKAIEPHDLAALIRAGRTIDLIDVRTPVEFAEVHAAGAALIPLATLDLHRVTGSRRNPDQPVYLLCKSGARATRACRRLAEAGFTDAVVVAGGTDAWVGAGLPVVRAPRVISLERQVRLAAGLLVLAGSILGALVSPWFYILCALVGGGLAFSAVTNTCRMALLLARMPWNAFDSKGAP
jgi:rhodanese-related sulfurtransferase